MATAKSKTRNLKLFVCSRSGNVGKSTLSFQFLEPMLEGTTQRFPIETINDVQGDALSPKELNNVLVDIDMTDNAIVDLGSSNFATIIDKLKKVANFNKFFDYFIIPTFVDKKQQRDGIKTLTELIDDLKISPNQIRVIYNRAEKSDISEFDLMNEAIERLKIPFSPTCISDDSLFGEMDKISIQELVLNEEQLKKLESEIETETDKEKRRALLTQKLYSNRATSLFADLQSAFNGMHLYG
jgi:hypothetical protein